MKKVTLEMEENLYRFYEKVGACAGGKAPERVMADALLRLAGELSADAEGKKYKKQ